MDFGADEEEEGVDFDDNLSFREDSLSVIKGEITLDGGRDVPVWVTTDTGSMTRLIESEYASRLKLPTKRIKPNQRFYINGPGGGRELISEMVTLDVRLKTKVESEGEESYDETSGEEVIRVVSMSFGLCQHLPVPILWGGGEMRARGVRDYHDRKVVSFQEESGERFITPSRSWVATCQEMGEVWEKTAKKAYKPFLPTRERLVQMVKGERTTGNIHGVLYPHTQSVVRLGRKNARIDEGYNEVALVNREEVEGWYGGKIEVVDSVCHGEAFAVVINTTSEVIKLPAGTLLMAIRPAINIPTVVKTRENGGEGERVGEDEPEGDWKDDDPLESAVVKVHPQTFYSWNMNGLEVRVRREELGLLYRHLKEKSPDVVALQELHLVQEGEDPTKPQEGKCRKAWESFFEELTGDYDAYLSLNTERKGGSALLVKKGLAARDVCYAMGGKKGHEEGGRFIKLTFPEMKVTATYVPFNGKGQEGHLDRRRRWDRRMRKELIRQG